MGNWALPLKAQLLDGNNYIVVSEDIVAPPVVQVLHFGAEPAARVSPQSIFESARIPPHN